MAQLVSGVSLALTHFQSPHSLCRGTCQSPGRGFKILQSTENAADRLGGPKEGRLCSSQGASVSITTRPPLQARTCEGKTEAGKVVYRRQQNPARLLEPFCRGSSSRDSSDLHTVKHPRLRRNMGLGRVGTMVKKPRGILTSLTRVSRFKSRLHPQLQIPADGGLWEAGVTAQ